MMTDARKAAMAELKREKAWSEREVLNGGNATYHAGFCAATNRAMDIVRSSLLEPVGEPVGYAFAIDLDRVKRDPSQTWRVDMRAAPQGSINVPLYRLPSTDGEGDG